MPLSQYILTAHDHDRLQTRLHNIWLIHLRWLYISLFGVVVVTSANFARNSMELRTFVIQLCAGGIAANFLFWLLLASKKRSELYYQSIAVAQIIFDVTLASFVIYFLGGLNGRATILYAIPIVGKGLLFGGSFGYLAAFLSSLFYGLTLWLYQYWRPGSYQLDAIVQPIIFYTCVFFVLAMMISRLATRASSQEREKSYAELLAMLRHQLYHPSGVVAAIVDMLEHGEHYPKWPAGDKAYLQQLKRENKRIHGMIANMFESMTDSEKELKGTKVFDVVQLLNEEAVSCATGAKRVADLETNLPNKVIEVEGNREQLSTAFDNVINNAFRYTERGTPVIISASEENFKVTISIHDKGKGISEEEQRALFKLFSKMEGHIGGSPEKLYDTGLGLYVSKLIIERHKGKLELSSSGEYGTNITITLFRRLI